MNTTKHKIQKLQCKKQLPGATPNKCHLLGKLLQEIPTTVTTSSLSVPDTVCEKLQKCSPGLYFGYIFFFCFIFFSSRKFEGPLMQVLIHSVVNSKNYHDLVLIKHIPLWTRYEKGRTHSFCKVQDRSQPINDHYWKPTSALLLIVLIGTVVFSIFYRCLVKNVLWG